MFYRVTLLDKFPKSEFIEVGWFLIRLSEAFQVFIMLRYQIHNSSLSSLFYRGQEPHIRYEHIYLPEHSSQSEVEYSEMKRPRLEMGAESLIRHQTHRQPLTVAGAEEMSKVSITFVLCLDISTSLMQYIKYAE